MARHILRFFYLKLHLLIEISTLDVSILSESENGALTEHYKIENREKSIAQFVKKHLSNCALEQMLFCFEDTGIYSMPLAYYLNDNELTYWQVPAVEIKRSKGIARGKDDKIDSKDIAFTLIRIRISYVKEKFQTNLFNN